MWSSSRRVLQELLSQPAAAAAARSFSLSSTQVSLYVVMLYINTCVKTRSEEDSEKFPEISECFPQDTYFFLNEFIVKM